MVVQGPLDFNLLLGHDHVYVMGTLASSLFHVVCFPHEGRIVTIDQLLFIGHQVPPMQPSCPIYSCLKLDPSSPQVNYVALSPMVSTSDDLDLVVDMVISSIGLLEPDLLTPIMTLDMVSF